jgi:hypothetical protein
LALLYPGDAEVEELAWLDWRLRRAFDGPDSVPLDPADLADVDWDRAVLTFVPTLSLGVVTTNCAAIWSAMAENGMPPAAEPLMEPAHVRVWRQDLSSRFKTISPMEAIALELGMDGATFGEICECAIAAPDEAQAMAAASEILTAWLADGVICKIR